MSLPQKNGLRIKNEKCRGELKIPDFSFLIFHSTLLIKKALCVGNLSVNSCVFIFRNFLLYSYRIVLSIYSTMEKKK